MNATWIVPLASATLASTVGIYAAYATRKSAEVKVRMDVAVATATGEAAKLNLAFAMQQKFIDTLVVRLDALELKLETTRAERDKVRDELWALRQQVSAKEKA